MEQGGTRWGWRGFLDENGRALLQPCLDVSGTRAFVSTSAPSGGDPRLLVYDVSDPPVPRMIGTAKLPGKQGFRVLAAEQTVFLVDITDPLTPKRQAQYRRADAWQVGAVRGDQLFVAKLDGLESLQVNP